MLNQSKLNLGRHICLSICLWLDRNSYLYEGQNSNRDIPIRLRVVIFSFGCNNSSMRLNNIFSEERLVVGKNSLKNTFSTTKCKG